jgi:hypothetical protein
VAVLSSVEFAVPILVREAPASRPSLRVGGQQVLRSTALLLNKNLLYGAGELAALMLKLREQTSAPEQAAAVAVLSSVEFTVPILVREAPASRPSLRVGGQQVLRITAHLLNKNLL